MNEHIDNIASIASIASRSSQPFASPQRILVFDIESSGLPPRSKPYSDTAAWSRCRIVQLAWQIFEPSGELLSEGCHIVRPIGFTVPESATRIHGITHRQAMADGRPLADVIADFHADIERHSVSRLVAHNIDFDRPVMMSEMVRLNVASHVIDRFERLDQFCTMKAGTKPGERWPKLAALYQELVGKEMIGGHRADVDTSACAAIYFALINNIPKC